MPEFTGGPYRRRTWWRSHLPWFLIDLGIAAKGKDCEAAGGHHEWYNVDGKTSGCYHCEVTRSGQLWKKTESTEQNLGGDSDNRAEDGPVRGAPQG